MASPIFKKTGLVRLATIQSVDPSTMTVDISFGNDIGDASLRAGSNMLFKAQLPMSYLSSGGGFIGGSVTPGTPVAVIQAEAGHHYFILAFLAKDPSSRSVTIPSKINKSLDTFRTLSDGDIVIQTNRNNFIKLDDSSITLGDFNKSLVLDVDRQLAINSFSNSYVITEAGREITGTILRGKKSFPNFSTALGAADGSFNSILSEIGMDPVADTTGHTYGTVVKNPARVEKRELVFEYEGIAKVGSNDEELKKYAGDTSVGSTIINNRRDSRADTLSLSLVYPNHLIETIKGTVVDVYGNILDINRNILPIGKKDYSISEIKLTANNQEKTTYDEIKRLERKSIAYHFEINARKESQKSSPPNISDRDNYARDRSRFFLDVDKEGLLKLNIPASSSTGNIPLHTRYENYSTINPAKKAGDKTSGDPNEAIFNEEYKDILIEKYLTTGPIVLVDETGNKIAPVDRFSDKKNPEYIGHGTVYHDITKVIKSSTKVQFYNPNEFIATTLFDPNSAGHITEIDPIVSEKIIVSGKDANAGGRSAFVNMDGSLEFSIGANQVDNHSIWLDTEGGVVASVGQDKNNISVAASLDGNVFLELGSTDIKKDKVFDLRVSDGVGNMTCFRIDKMGLSVSTQGRSVIYSSGDMMLRSAARITMDAEEVIIMGRSVYKDPSKGPIR